MTLEEKYEHLLETYGFKIRVPNDNIFRRYYVRSDYNENNEQYRYHNISCSFDGIFEFYTNYCSSSFSTLTEYQNAIHNDMNYDDFDNGFMANSIKELSNMMSKYFKLESRKRKLNKL
jgi:hypothetical protein